VSDRRCEHCKATESLAIDPMLMGHVDFTCHHNYPAPMPPIVHHSCPDCLALAKVILNATYMTQPKDGHVRADREALRQPLTQFIKEREK